MYDDDDNDPDRWCPLSRTVAGDSVPAFEVWPSPEWAARKTDPSDVDRILGLVECFNPACERANLNMGGLAEFHPDRDWLLRYAAELRRIRDAV